MVLLDVVLLVLQILRGHSSSVRDVAYSPSGRHIASASLDGDVKLWSATQGSQVRAQRDCRNTLIMWWLPPFNTPIYNNQAKYNSAVLSQVIQL